MQRQTTLGYSADDLKKYGGMVREITSKPVQDYLEEKRDSCNVSLFSLQIHFQVREILFAAHQEGLPVTNFTDSSIFIVNEVVNKNFIRFPIPEIRSVEDVQSIKWMNSNFLHGQAIDIRTNLYSAKILLHVLLYGFGPWHYLLPENFRDSNQAKMNDNERLRDLTSRSYYYEALKSYYIINYSQFEIETCLAIDKNLYQEALYNFFCLNLLKFIEDDKNQNDIALLDYLEPLACLSLANYQSSELYVIFLKAFKEGKPGDSNVKTLRQYLNDHQHEIKLQIESKNAFNINLSNWINLLLSKENKINNLIKKIFSLIESLQRINHDTSLLVKHLTELNQKRLEMQHYYLYLTQFFGQYHQQSLVKACNEFIVSLQDKLLGNSKIFKAIETDIQSIQQMVVTSMLGVPTFSKALSEEKLITSEKPIFSRQAKSESDLFQLAEVKPPIIVISKPNDQAQPFLSRSTPTNSLGGGLGLFNPIRFPLNDSLASSGEKVLAFRSRSASPTTLSSISESGSISNSPQSIPNTPEMSHKSPELISNSSNSNSRSSKNTSPRAFLSAMFSKGPSAPSKNKKHDKVKRKNETDISQRRKSEGHQNLNK